MPVTYVAPSPTDHTSPSSLRRRSDGAAGLSARVADRPAQGALDEAGVGVGEGVAQVEVDVVEDDLAQPQGRQVTTGHRPGRRASPPRASSAAPASEGAISANRAAEATRSATCSAAGPAGALGDVGVAGLGGGVHRCRARRWSPSAPGGTGASALRAMCVTTWARVHPSHRLGARASPRRPAGPRWPAAPASRPAAARGSRAGGGAHEPKRDGGADQRQVGERLREVADHPLARRVVLLGEQADVVGQRRRSRSHQRVRVVEPPGRGVGRDQPERAGQERVLVAGQPVDAGLGAVAQQQPVAHQVLLDRRDGAEHPRVVAVEEADEREHQQRGVDLGGVVVLGEGVALGVEALRQDLVAHLRRAARATARPGPSRPCSSTARTARSKAAHTMTREWVKCRSGPRISHSPLSGSLPVLGEVVDQRALQRPGVVGLARGRASRARLEGDHHLAEHVGLPLVDRAVADPHRPRAGVAGQVVERRARAARGAPSTAYMICRSCGVAGDGAQQPVAPQPGLLGVAARRAAPRGSARRRAASSSGSPSCARRRSPRAATWSAPRRCRRCRRGSAARRVSSERRHGVARRGPS